MFEFLDPKNLYELIPELKHENVQSIEEWIKTQPHLPQIPERIIIIFYYGSYFNMEVAKIRIEKYFTLRTKYFDLFKHLSKEELKTTASAIMFHVLPKRTPDDKHVFLEKLLDTEPENFHAINSIRFLDMVGSLAAYELEPGDGVFIVLDAKGFSIGHLMKTNLFTLKHSLDLLQESAPLRIKGIHVINISPIMDKFLAVIKPLVKNELFSLVQFHSSFDTFLKYVPEECLPEDYGGKLPSCRILQEQNLNNLLDKFEYFPWHDTFKADESRRLGKKDRIEEVRCSFKKLEID